MDEFSNARNTSEREERDPGTTEPRADTTPDPARGGFRATWARTTNNARIGKVKTPSGKWPPTPGAKSKSYVFETREYASIVEFYADYEERQKSGIWTLIAGELRPDLDPNKPHQRVGPNFIDAASTKFTIDFDGLEPDDAAMPLDSPSAYEEDAAFLAALNRLPKAFDGAMCMAAATSSTGSKIVSTGKPSEGRARFRATWELTRALTCRQKEILTKAMKALPGLDGVSNDLCSIPGFEFISRPVFLEGENDPIKDPVYLLEGGLLDIDAVCHELGIDLDAAANGGGGGKAQSRPRGTSPGQGRPLTPDEAQALYLSHKQAKPLLHALADSVVNGPWFDYRPHWIGYAHTTRNVFGRDVGWLKFDEFNKRRIGADGQPVKNDPVQDKEAYDTLKNSQNNIWDLAGYAREHGGEAGRKAYYDFLYPDLTPEDKALVDGMIAAPEKAADAQHGGAWAEWRAALERLRAARPAPIFDNSGWLPHSSNANVLIFDPEDISPVPLRPDMTDRHARGEASMLVGSGGGGKSTVGTSYTVAVAYENPAPIGQSSIDWCGDVVVVSNEESPRTVKRRIRALRHRLGLSPKDQKHRIFIWPDTLVLGRATGSDGVAPTRMAITFVDTLAQLNAESEIALVVLDTLASLFSGVNENSVAMEKAVGMLADIAEAGFLAIDIMHHASKAQDGRETAMSFRGSTAIGAKVREHSTIVPVPKDEWPTFGWSDAEGAHTVRVLGQKANDKAIAGAWCFRWEFPSVGAYDVRKPDEFKSAAIGILVPLGKPTAKRVAPQAALRALYAFHQNGGKIVRGGVNGPVAPHHAHRILIDAGLGDRKAAEALIVELLKEKLLTAQPGWIGGHNVTFLIPGEPEEEV